ncbi:MAG: hypothetical protein ACI8ZM_001603 [Crocinitomix sp.]|jgi:hypothetical protein
MHSISQFNTRILVLFLALFLMSGSSFAVEKLSPSLSLIVGGEKILNGSSVNGKRDFSKAKFRIVDQNGNGLNYFTILEGHILPAQSDVPMRGSILESGELDAVSIELLTKADGEKMTAFVKVLDKSDNTTVGIAFHFYINVKPEIVFGNVTQGQKDVSKEMVAGLQTLLVEFSENRDLISYNVVSGTVAVDGVDIKGEVLGNGVLDDNAQQALSQAAGKQVTILVKYADPSGAEKRTALVFTVAT